MEMEVSYVQYDPELGGHACEGCGENCNGTIISHGGDGKGIEVLLCVPCAEIVRDALDVGEGLS